jgi:peptide deformylase
LASVITLEPRKRLEMQKMAIRKILLLGNPKLHEVSQPVGQREVGKMEPVVHDLHDTLMAFRKEYGVGRAIAAPQIGVMKRLFYMCIDEPVVFINPRLASESQEMMAVWDDCMCFPDLLVRVLRHRTCRVYFRNMGWEETLFDLEEGLSELIQHEYDHLDGILAVDGRSFALKGHLPP